MDAPTPRRLVHVACALATLALGIAATAPATASAHAAEQWGSIDDYVAVYDLGADGSMQVTLDFTYNMGPEGGHGPQVRIPVQVATDDPDTDRAYPLSEVAASSPDAPAAVRLTTKHGVTTVSLGDPDTTVTGPHDYHLTYRQDGVITPGESGEVFRWDVLTELEVWATGTAAVVTAPVAARDASCTSTEPADGDSCDVVTAVGPDTDPPFAVERLADAEGNLTAPLGSAVFSEFVLTTGDSLSITATYPVGTFPSAAVINADPSVRTAYAFEWTPMTTALVVGLGAIAVAVLLRLLLWPLRRDSRRASKRAVASVPVAVDPWGSAPGSPEDLATVRSTPPDGVQPWQLAILETGRKGIRDLAAMLADLARRGIIEVERRDPITGNGVSLGNWEFRAAPRLLTASGAEILDPMTAGRWSDLSAAERLVLEAMFRDGDAVTLARLRGARLETITTRLAQQSISDAARSGLFRPGMGLVWGFIRFGRILAVIAALAAIPASAIASTHDAAGPALLASGGVLIAGLILASGRRTTGRSARGVESAAQSVAFKAYLGDVAYGRRPVHITSRDATFAVAYALGVPFTRVIAENPALHHDAGSTCPWWLFLDAGASDMLARPPARRSGSD